jgi:hypothetical protein
LHQAAILAELLLLCTALNALQVANQGSGVTRQITALPLLLMHAEGAAKLWASRMGCPSSAVANPATIYTDSSQKVTCKDYCRQQQQEQMQGKQRQGADKQLQSSKQQQQQQPVVLCSVDGAPHQLLKVMPGYPAALIRWAAPEAAGGAAFKGAPKIF